MKMQVVIIPRDLGIAFVTWAMKGMELTVKVHFIFPIGFPCNLDQNVLFKKIHGKLTSNRIKLKQMVLSPFKHQKVNSHQKSET